MSLHTHLRGDLRMFYLMPCHNVQLLIIHQKPSRGGALIHSPNERHEHNNINRRITASWEILRTTCCGKERRMARGTSPPFHFAFSFPTPPKCKSILGQIAACSHCGGHLFKFWFRLAVCLEKWEGILFSWQPGPWRLCGNIAGGLLSTNVFIR